jgi:hypothetical protein
VPLLQGTYINAKRSPVKKIVVVVAVLASVLCVELGGEGLLHSTEIWGSICFGSLEAGFQRDLPDQTLSPPPDGLTALLPMFGIRTYFAGPLGGEVFAGIFGSTRTQLEGYKSVTMYDFETINLGPILRFAFRVPGGSAVFSVFAGGGVTYSLLSLSSDYTSLFGGLTFYDVLPDFGWYAKAGVAWYPSSSFFADATAWYYTANAKFDVGGKELDGTYFFLAFSVGFAF